MAVSHEQPLKIDELTIGPSKTTVPVHRRMLQSGVFHFRKTKQGIPDHQYALLNI
jgi:hypothetical protein